MATKAGLSSGNAERAVAVLFEIISDTLENGGVHIAG
jgi:nucleoid DNA-binding protein